MIDITARMWDANRIKALRKALRISQTELANIIALRSGQNEVSRWERGVHNPSVRMQEKLTYLARERQVAIELDNIDMRNLVASIDDLLAELNMNWIPQEPAGIKQKRNLVVKSGKLQQARDLIAWEDFIYRTSQ